MKIDEVQKSPASWPPRGTAGQEGLKYFFSHSNRRGGVASGAAAFIAILKEGHLF